jgi:hypothetical protein
MNTAEILRKARALIETKGWTQHAIGRRPDGSPIHLADNLPQASCFCAEGAILMVAGLSYGRREFTRSAGTVDRAVGLRLHQWNDAPGRTREEVLDAFDKAIALARASADASQEPKTSATSAAGSSSSRERSEHHQ